MSRWSEWCAKGGGRGDAFGVRFTDLTHFMTTFSYEFSQHAGEQPLSRNAQKKKRKWEQKRARMKAKKMRRKEQKRLMRTSAPHHAIPTMSQETINEHRANREKRKKAWHDAAMSGVHGTVVIDCEFSHLMTAKERISLTQQLMYSYGINRKTLSPLRLMLCGVDADLRSRLNKISGFDRWAVTASAKSYTDVVPHPKSTLVYLTADSPNEISALDPSKAYIIGGLVDRNRYKNVTLEKAQEQGIAHARLPIGRFMEEMKFSKVLTVNNVFDILCKFVSTRDWRQALRSCVPKRKAECNARGSLGKRSRLEEHESNTMDVE